MKGHGRNVDIISGGDIGARCIAWRIGCIPSKVSWVRTGRYYQAIGAARGTRKGH
jgi:pyruvate/2-oxoglutarate dehydrogenase complex dihydrolipoamide dehydrogenase (E3) component